MWQAFFAHKDRCLDLDPKEAYTVPLATSTSASKILRRSATLSKSPVIVTLNGAPVKAAGIGISPDTDVTASRFLE